MKHVPVLLNEVIEKAKLTEAQRPRIWDATFGRGGHTNALLEALPNSFALGTDRDIAAINFGRENYSELLSSQRLELKHFNFHDFSHLKSLDQKEGFDIILLDLGVSSPQLDQAERGFSFYHDGPLDMRMDQSQDFSAADIINTWSESDLIHLFQVVGEIPRPHRVVQEIIDRRKTKPFSTTMELSLLIERTFGWRKKGKHPATNFFLALRMEVNQELNPLHESVEAIMTHALKPKGLLLMITFHSAEDRIIKRLFKNSESLGRPLTKKVIAPERAEILLNPRSRSAKLRVFQRELQPEGEH